MHYITYIVLMLASISSYAAKQDIFQGSWYSEGVVYSFINDSLYVDEIGNEGDIYTYKYKDGIITAISSLGDEFSFKIDKISSDKIKIKFDGERPFVLDKVFNYDLDKMESPGYSTRMFDTYKVYYNKQTLYKQADSYYGVSNNTDFKIKYDFIELNYKQYQEFLKHFKNKIYNIKDV